MKTTTTTKNYIITIYEGTDTAKFMVTDKAVQNKKRKLNNLAYAFQYAIPNKNGKFPIKFPHNFTVIGTDNIQAFIDLINA